jgi:hypothetical protein
MSYVFRSVGAVAEGNGSLNPGAPAGVVVGDLLLLSLVGRDNGQTAPAPSGWTLVSPASPVGWNYLYARIADGTAADTPTGLLYTGTIRSQAQIAAFSGGGFSLSTIVTNSVSQYLPGTQTAILYSAGLTIAPANCLVIAVGTKNKTATSNGTTINNLTGFTKIDSNVVNGTDISQWWGYQIQTTATNIAASLSQTLTGTTETLQYTSLLVALQSSLDLPATTGPYAYTGGSASFASTVNPNPSLLAGAGTYNYSLAPSSSDFGFDAGFTTYQYTGYSVFLTPTISPIFLTASTGVYSIDAKTVTFTFFVPPVPIPTTPNTNPLIWTADSIVLNASGSPGHWHNTQEEPYYQWTADGRWDFNGVLSRYGLQHGVPPQLGKNVTSRTFSWNEMARRAWGSEFSAPDHRIYVWSNGRSFDSTDMGETGIYEHVNEDS